MAMTQSGLLILAGIGLLSAVGMLRDYRDPATPVAIAAIATVTWAFFSFSSLDVIVRDNYAATASEPMYPLVYLGALMALTSFLALLSKLMSWLGSEAGAGEVDLV